MELDNVAPRLSNDDYSGQRWDENLCRTDLMSTLIDDDH